jgi:hypothetical protein
MYQARGARRRGAERDWRCSSQQRKRGEYRVCVCRVFGSQRVAFVQGLTITAEALIAMDGSKPILVQKFS